MNVLDIREDDLSGEAIATLLREHLAHMHAVTPVGSAHALDLDGLKTPDITFWSVWRGDELVGCGALRELDPRTGEIKSMRIAEAHRRGGVASRLLQHIVETAEKRAYTHLHLETGSFAAFAPARAFYERHGFTYRGPFAVHTDDPNSVFMTRAL